MTIATARIHDIRTVSTHDSFHGWPTIARRNNGQLLLVASAGRDYHVCPWGQVRMIRSDDDGQTWGPSELLVNGPIDDRDAGVLETAKGTLLVNWFTSLAWLTTLEGVENGTTPDRLSERELTRWQKMRANLSDELIQREMGVWMIRSEDGGKTWSSRIPTLCNSPHGPTQLSDGRLLYAGKRRADVQPGDRRSPFQPIIGVAQSSDDGCSWQWLSEIPTRSGDTPNAYHELHQVEAADGRIVVHIRNHNEQTQYEILQSHSTDGGKSWSVPQSTGIWGYPAFLTRLRDGRLLTTYSHRRDPRGNYACVSEDHGQSWSQPIAINTDCTSDMGYPSTVQLADGSLLTAWYDKSFSTLAQLRVARWSLD